MMCAELSYPEDKDERIIRRSEILLGDLKLTINAMTIAGKGTTQNQDAFGFSVHNQTLSAIV
jgi:hypothetical protein